MLKPTSCEGFITSGRSIKCPQAWIDVLPVDHRGDIDVTVQQWGAGVQPGGVVVAQGKARISPGWLLLPPTLPLLHDGLDTFLVDICSMGAGQQVIVRLQRA